MNASVLCLQANERVALTIKGRFDEGLVEFLIVSTAEEAFNVYNERPVTLTLVDANITDMKIKDFLSRCSREYPDMLINVCMDVKEPAQIQSLTSNPSVVKIFVPPWDVDIIVEGVEDSLDSAQIGNDFVRRKRELEREELEFARTLERLKSSLVRQKYSYNRIEPILNSTLKAFVDMSGVSEDMSDFIEKVCNKMLLLETATPLKCSELNKVITASIEENSGSHNLIKVEKVDSCLMGDVAKSKMADVILGIYMLTKLESFRCDDITVNVSSEYKSSTNVQFKIVANGNWNDKDIERQEKYAERILANIVDKFEYIEDGNNHIWEIDIVLH